MKTIDGQSDTLPRFGTANVFRLGSEISAIPNEAMKALCSITGRTDGREARRITNHAANTVAPVIKTMLDAPFRDHVLQTAEALRNTEMLVEGIRRSKAGLDASARAKLATTVEAVIGRAREDLKGTKELERLEKTLERWEKDVRHF